MRKLIKPIPKTISTTEMELGIARLFNIRKSIIVPNISWGFNMHECDVFIVRNSGYCVEVEIKRSIQDLKKDFLKKHDHVDKHNRICEFYYAIPEELYDKCRDLIPENAGIILCYSLRKIPRGRIVRKAIRIKNARKLTAEEILKVAKLGCMRIFSLKEKIIKLQNGKG